MCLPPRNIEKAINTKLCVYVFQFVEKRKEMKSDGRTEKELDESYCFLLADALKVRLTLNCIVNFMSPCCFLPFPVFRRDIERDTPGQKKKKKQIGKLVDKQDINPFHSKRNSNNTHSFLVFVFSGKWYVILHIAIMPISLYLFHASMYFAISWGGKQLGVMRLEQLTFGISFTVQGQKLIRRD